MGIGRYRGLCCHFRLATTFQLSYAVLPCLTTKSVRLILLYTGVLKHVS
nr:MAG TPA: hypothetical protein [Caudoviricetes sp.]